MVVLLKNITINKQKNGKVEEIEWAEKTKQDYAAKKDKLNRYLHLFSYLQWREVIFFKVHYCLETSISYSFNA